MKELKCPTGHSLPSVVNGITCSESYCSQMPAPSLKQRKEDRIKKERELLKKDTLTVPYRQAQKLTTQLKHEVAKNIGGVDDDAVQIVKNLSMALGKYEARKAYVKAPDPKGMQIEEIREWVDKKLTELSIDAVTRLEVDLKLGDDDVSRRAALEALDRSGFGRKDGGSAPGAPIIIVNNSGEQKAYRPAFLVDAEVVKK